MQSFSSILWDPDESFQIDSVFPTQMRCVVDGRMFVPPGHLTTYGYVASGTARISTPDAGFVLREGMFFSVPGELQVATSSGKIMLVQRFGYRGVVHVGGPIEHRGRLRYIDGCTDSLLIAPQRFGEPCLNLLYFPPGIEQTMHTHPSSRSGLIMSGHGKCDTPDGMIDLDPGMLFCIHTDGPHRFITTDHEMRVLAFHPDSDFGPRDEDHPMLNRTFVGDASARTNDDIRTNKRVQVEYEQ